MSLHVTVAHNFYVSSSPSGENSAVSDDVIFLRSVGCDVAEYFVMSDDLDTNRARMCAARTALGSKAAEQAAVRRLSQSGTQILHVHNLFPNLGPSIVRAARQLGIPVVQTVHNRRLACLAGMNERNGQECTLCNGTRFKVPGVKFACYRGSRAQSALTATTRAVHDELLTSLDHYFIVSQFLQESLIGEGVSPSRISVKYNPCAESVIDPRVPRQRGLVFAGRLSQGKGFQALADAWRGMPASTRPPLTICGDGPLTPVAVDLARDPGCRFLGKVGSNAVRAVMRQNSVVAIPSIGNEGLPRILTEALAESTPVLTFDHPAMNAIVRSGCGLTVGRSVQELRAGIERIDQAPGSEPWTAMSDKALAVFTSQFAAEPILRAQLGVYSSLLPAT